MDISALNLLEGTDIGFLHVCDPCENHYFYNPDEDIIMKELGKHTNYLSVPKKVLQRSYHQQELSF